jgi:hypothetical protein
MNSTKLSLAKVYFLIVLCLCCLPVITSADLTGEYQAIEEIAQYVSIDNILNTVSDLQENRDVNSPDISYKSRYCLRVRDASDPTDGACDNAADYIFNKFASYGLDVEYDPFIHTVTKKVNNVNISNNYKMRNVVATLHGKGPHSNKTYIICSHYDSIAGLSAGWMWNWKSLPAPGADDNASGTSAVMEAARILSHYDFDFSIEFITFSGEELGMFGSKHFAKDASDLGHQIAGVINLDMIGYDPDEPDIATLTNEDSEWMANAISHVRNEYDFNLAVNKVINPKMIFSDHSSFWKVGYSAVLVSEASDSSTNEFSPVNHTPNDTLDKLNPELFLNTSKLAIATLAQLADPIVEPNDTLNPDLAISDDSIIMPQVAHKPRSTVMLEANVENLGNDDAVDVSAQIWLVPPETWLHSNLLKEITFDVKAKSSYEINEAIPLGNWGDYSVIIKINPNYRIFESDYTNNIARKAIQVSEEQGISDLLIYPNPLVISKNLEVNIRYRLSNDANVTLNVYDILGNLVYNLNFNPGENGGLRGPNNNIKWDANTIASGIYICLVTMTDESGEKHSVSKKLAIIR